MRDTRYAKELTPPGVVKFSSGGEGRVERLLVKELDAVEIRFSWWQDGNMLRRPLDLGEDALLTLMADGVANGVFTPEFRAMLRDILA
jgi:hypothetical protein